MNINFLILCAILITNQYIYSFETNNLFHFNNHFKLNNNNKNSLNDVVKLVKQQKCYSYLSTQNYSNKLLGFPHTSLVGFTIDEFGYPILAMSDISQHTKNLKKNNKISLLVTKIGLINQSEERTGISGFVNKINKDEIDHYKKIYKTSHNNAFWVDFPDFNLYKMDKVIDIYYIGGFGKATKINVDKYFDKF